MWKWDGENSTGGSNYILHNPTNQISELGLSFPYINIGRTGVSRKKRNWLCRFQLDPSDSINWASLPGSYLIGPVFMHWSSFGQVQGCAKGGGREGRGAFPRQPVGGTRAAQELSMGLQPSWQQGRSGEDLSAGQGHGGQPADWGMCLHHSKMAEQSSGWFPLFGGMIMWLTIQIQTLIYRSNPDSVRVKRALLLFAPGTTGKHTCPWHLTIRSLFLHCFHSFEFFKNV